MDLYVQSCIETATETTESEWTERGLNGKRVIRCGFARGNCNAMEMLEKTTWKVTTNIWKQFLLFCFDARTKVTDALCASSHK